MRLLNSLSFRLALVYAGLFLVSVCALAGLYYWVSIHRPLESVRAEVVAESAEVMRLYGAGGPEVAARFLERRVGVPSPRMAYHALLRPDGSVVTTNLPSWPREHTRTWLRIEADISHEGGEEEYKPLVLDRMLPDGGRLLIGRDIDDLDDIEEAMKEAAVWLLPMIVLLVISGGALMSRSIGRRIDAVSAAARRVIEGNLSERVPLQGTGDDFDRLGETLNLMLARIEDLVEAVRRVSDSVAHELRTPLTRLHADLRELCAAPEPDRERLLGALEEAERLGGMFDAVLRISRIEAQRHAADIRPIDLSKLLHDAAEFYQPAAAERAQTLDVDIAPRLKTTGDPDLLFQAMSNLLDNAVKFTPEGGTIRLTGAVDGPEVVVTVSDTGPGIPPHLIDKVVERFFRAPAASDVPGFGLGLSLVAAVAAHHGSKLRFVPAAQGLRVEWRFRVGSH